MLKKNIRNLILCLLITLSAYVISACCGPKMCEITVNFMDVDSSLEISNYTEIIEAGYPVKVTIELPVGYVYDNFSAKVGDYPLDWEVKLSDPTIEPEFEYTVSKTITVKVDRVNNDHQIDIDMSGVRLKKLKINIADDILKNSITQDEDDRDMSNLQIVTINPDYLTNLMYLRGDAITGQIPVSVSGEVYVDYDSYAILCFTKENSKQEMSTIYSTVGKYTPENKIIEYKENKYAEYNLAVKGNVPYNLYEGNSAISKTRLYYMGQIKENMEFYRQIPDFDVTKGFAFNDKENQFVLLTNRQDYNSNLLSISAYVPTVQSYNEENPLLDKVDGKTITKLEKYNSDGSIKNANVYGEFGMRYDMLSFYLGESIVSDLYLTEEEKASLSKEIYIEVDSKFVIGELEVYLLSYEKQTKNDFPKLRLTEFFTSEKGKTIFKFDRAVVEEFLKQRTDSASGSEYVVGNAIFYVSIARDVMDENWYTKEYTTLMFPLIINGSTIDYSNDYRIEIFVEDKEGNIDYGFVDMQGTNCDIAVFESNQLYDWDGSEWNARRDLYIKITGPDYNDYYSPVIETIFLYKPYKVSLVGQFGEKVEDPKTLNGLDKYSINVAMSLNGVNNSTYIGRQFRIDVALNITTKNTGTFNMDFSNIEFADKYNDAIYMRNDIDFDAMEDFKRVDSIAINSGDVNIRFGYYTDIYYFVYSEDESLEFDVYVGQQNTETEEYEGVYDANRKISETKELKDILGNVVKIRDNAGKWHIVYTKYQWCDIYRIDGGEHFAYNPNTEGIPQE